jgi:hypothetical protein
VPPDAVSCAVSGTPALSVFGSTWRRFGLVAQCAVLLLAWTVAASPAPGRVLVRRAIVFASAAAAVFGIAEYFGWDPLPPASAYHIGEGIWTIVRPPAVSATSATLPPGC